MLFCWLLCAFFFQAEDGIRDLVRSRGLGDVYKRQGRKRVGEEREHERQHDEPRLRRLEDLLGTRGREPVSYTHLTLPTSDLG